MKHEVIERTAREWATSDSERAARDVARLAATAGVTPRRSGEELYEALVLIAARLELAETRAW